MACEGNLDEFSRIEERKANDVIGGTPDLKRHIDRVYENDFVPVLASNMKMTGPKKEGRNLLRDSNGKLVLVTKYKPASHLIPQLLFILSYDDETAFILTETVNVLRRSSVDVTVDEATCLICKWVYWKYRGSTS